MNKDYFIKPFPINFSTDEMFEYYCSKNKVDYKEFYEIIKSDGIVVPRDDEKIRELYTTIYEFFIKDNFKRGCYAILHNGYQFFKILLKNKNISNVVEDFEFDFTHFVGMTKEDLQLIILPFETIKDVDYFGYAIRKHKVIDYWENGKKIGDNLKYFEN